MIHLKIQYFMIYVHACVLSEVFSLCDSALSQLQFCSRCTYKKSVALTRNAQSVCFDQWSYIECMPSPALANSDWTQSASVYTQQQKLKQTSARNNNNNKKNNRGERQRPGKINKRNKNGNLAQKTTMMRRCTLIGENLFHFSCSLFIVIIIFRIYMFDFIIIRVVRSITNQKENKGAHIDIEIIGLHTHFYSNVDGIWYAILCFCLLDDVVCVEQKWKQNKIRERVHTECTVSRPPLVCMAKN